MIDSLADAKRSFEKIQQALIDKVEYLDLELRTVSIGLKNKLEEAQKFRDQMNRLFECLPIGAILIHQDGTIIQMNQSATSILGSEHPLRKGQLLESGWRKLGLPSIPFSFCSYQDKWLTCWEEALGKPGVVPCLTVRFIANELRSDIQPHNSETLCRPGMDDVIAKVAHDLRNPLSSIELFSSLVVKRPCNESAHHSLGTHLLQSVRSLALFVSHMLLEKKSNRMHRDSVNLNVLLEQVKTLLTHALQAHQVVIRQSVSAEVEIIEGDSTLLQRACLNVLHNAILASPKGGVIAIDCRRVKKFQQMHQIDVDEVCIQIHDKGSGINGKDLPHIKQLYYSNRSGGTGLGLSIVKDVMDAHQGTIEIRSREGQGTTVSLIFPQQRRSE
ncbi:MAG: sensor histidine kinase [Nitrospirales bacterium]